MTVILSVFKDIAGGWDRRGFFSRGSYYTLPTRHGTPRPHGIPYGTACHAAYMRTCTSSAPSYSYMRNETFDWYLWHTLTRKDTYFSEKGYVFHETGYVTVRVA